MGYFIKVKPPNLINIFRKIKSYMVKLEILVGPFKQSLRGDSLSIVGGRSLSNNEYFMHLRQLFNADKIPVE